MAFLGPIVTFESPIAAFYCKFFFISPIPASRGPIVAFLSPIAAF